MEPNNLVQRAYHESEHSVRANFLGAGVSDLTIEEGGLGHSGVVHSVPPCWPLPAFIESPNGSVVLDGRRYQARAGTRGWTKNRPNPGPGRLQPAGRRTAEPLLDLPSQMPWQI